MMAQAPSKKDAEQTQEPGTKPPYMSARLVIPSKGIYGDLRRLVDSMGELEKMGYRVFWRTLDPEETSCSLPHIELNNNGSIRKFSDVSDLEDFLRHQE